MFGNAESEFARFGGGLFQGSGTGFAFDARENGFEEQSSVVNGASERTCAVEAWRKRNDAVHADAAESGFEANDAAESSGNTDGAAGVSADAAEAEASSDSSCGTAAGAAGNSGKIPGIVDGAEVRVVAGDAVGELVHVGLAENDGAGIFELRDHRGVVQGNEFRENF